MANAAPPSLLGSPCAGRGQRRARRATARRHRAAHVGHPALRRMRQRPRRSPHVEGAEQPSLGRSHDSMLVTPRALRHARPGDSSRASDAHPLTTMDAPRRPSRPSELERPTWVSRRHRARQKRRLQGSSIRAVASNPHARPTQLRPRWSNEHASRQAARNRFTSVRTLHLSPQPHPRPRTTWVMWLRRTPNDGRRVPLAGKAPALAPPLRLPMRAAIQLARPTWAPLGRKHLAATSPAGTTCAPAPPCQRIVTWRMPPSAHRRPTWAARRLDAGRRRSRRRVHLGARGTRAANPAHAAHVGRLPWPQNLAAISPAGNGLRSGFALPADPSPGRARVPPRIDRPRGPRGASTPADDVHGDVFTTAHAGLARLSQPTRPTWAASLGRKTWRRSPAGNGLRAGAALPAHRSPGRACLPPPCRQAHVGRAEPRRRQTMFAATCSPRHTNDSANATHAAHVGRPPLAGNTWRRRRRQGRLALWRRLASPSLTWRRRPSAYRRAHLGRAEARRRQKTFAATCSPLHTNDSANAAHAAHVGRGTVTAGMTGAATRRSPQWECPAPPPSGRQPSRGLHGARARGQAGMRALTDDGPRPDVHLGTGSHALPPRRHWPRRVHVSNVKGQRSA
jgi:hypothetical protein